MAVSTFLVRRWATLCQRSHHTPRRSLGAGLVSTSTRQSIQAGDQRLTAAFSKAAPRSFATEALPPTPKRPIIGATGLSTFSSIHTRLCFMLSNSIRYPDRHRLLRTGVDIPSRSHSIDISSTGSCSPRKELRGGRPTAQTCRSGSLGDSGVEGPTPEMLSTA